MAKTDLDMSKASLRLAYDGEALASHRMDVRDLAPALMGLGELLNAANFELNGKNVGLEVKVAPNIHQKCFDIGLEVYQQWEAIKSLFGDDNVVTAKELLDWLAYGSIAGTPLIALFKNLRGRKPESIIKFKDENGNQLYRYQFEGQDDTILDEKLHKLYQSKNVRSGLKKLFKPVSEKDGIDKVTAYDPANAATFQSVRKREVATMDFRPLEALEAKDLASPSQSITANLRVYAPVYDLSASNWRLWLDESHHYMDVSESNIAQVALEHGGVLIDDIIRAKIEITEKENTKGEIVKNYKVLEVISFTPAIRQTRQESLFEISNNDED